MAFSVAAAMQALSEGAVSDAEAAQRARAEGAERAQAQLEARAAQGDYAALLDVVARHRAEGAYATAHSWRTRLAAAYPLTSGTWSPAHPASQRSRLARLDRRRRLLRR